MKKRISAIAMLGLAFAASATQLQKRDVGDMKDVAEFAATKELVKTGEPVNLGKDKYEVTVTVGDRVCKATVQPDPDGSGPWRWKVAAMKCPIK